MKKLILFFFFIYTFSCLANEQDTIEIVEYDSLSAISKNHDKDGFNFIVSGGLGMSTGSTWNSWEDYHTIGPAISFGLEIPFTSSDFLSFELLGYYWISDSFDYDYETRLLSGDYKIINKKDDSHMGLSIGLKFLIINLYEKPDKLRLNGHISYVLLNPGGIDSPNFDLGLDLCYEFNKSISISLMRRVIIPLNIPLAGGTPTEYVPNLLIINFNYKFKW